MKSYIPIFLISALFLLNACKKKEVQTQKSEAISVIAADTIIIPISTQGLKPSLRLTPKANEAAKYWPVYQNLTKRLDSLQGVSLATVKNQLSLLIIAFDGQQEAEEEILDITPDNLETPAIEARLLSVETKLKVLNNYAQKSNPNPQEISNAVVQLKNAVQNLNLQVNEKFATSIEEMLKQLGQEVNDTTISLESEKSNPTGKPSLTIPKTNQ